MTSGRRSRWSAASVDSSNTPPGRRTGRRTRRRGVRGRRPDASHDPPVRRPPAASGSRPRRRRLQGRRRGPSAEPSAAAAAPASRTAARRASRSSSGDSGRSGVGGVGGSSTAGVASTVARGARRGLPRPRVPGRLDLAQLAAGRRQVGLDRLQVADRVAALGDRGVERGVEVGDALLELGDPGLLLGEARRERRPRRRAPRRRPPRGAGPPARRRRACGAARPPRRTRRSGRALGAAARSTRSASSTSHPSGRLSQIHGPRPIVSASAASATRARNVVVGVDHPAHRRPGRLARPGEGQDTAEAGRRRHRRLLGQAGPGHLERPARARDAGREPPVTGRTSICRRHVLLARAVADRAASSADALSPRPAPGRPNRPPRRRAPRPHPTARTTGTRRTRPSSPSTCSSSTASSPPTV